MQFTIFNATPADDGGLIVQGHLATHYAIAVRPDGVASVKPNAARTPDADLEAAIAAAVSSVVTSPGNLERLTVSIERDRAPRAVLPDQAPVETPVPSTATAAVDAVPAAPAAVSPLTTAPVESCPDAAVVTPPASAAKT